MIITRTPLRISIGGGGTDLPSYYQQHSGFLIAAAIDKYVYITVNETFQREFIVKYANLERTSTIDEISHPIVREALQALCVEKDGFLEITSMADIPSGTGLGAHPDGWARCAGQPRGGAQNAGVAGDRGRERDRPGDGQGHRHYPRP